MKTYSNKSNAVRAMNTYTQKVQEHLIGAEVDKQADKEFVVKFEMKADTPAETVEMLEEKFLVEVEVVKVETAPKAEGLKIQKDREERNGIKRPSAGGKCAQLWDLFDAMYAEKGMVPTPKPAKERSAQFNLDPVTTQVQLYKWREFMGFKGK